MENETTFKTVKYFPKRIRPAALCKVELVNQQWFVGGRKDTQCFQY